MTEPQKLTPGVGIENLPKLKPHIVIDRLTKERGEYEAKIAALEAEKVKLEADVKVLREALDKDKTGLAHALNAVRKEADARRWVIDGRGSYEWDDERYRKETGWALKAIEEIAVNALRASGTLATEALSKTSSETQGGEKNED